MYLFHGFNHSILSDMENENDNKPQCPECGSSNTDILDDEGIAICCDCYLEWPYSREE